MTENTVLTETPPVTEEILSGEIVHLTFHDPLSAFTVAKLRSDKKTALATIVGHMPFVQVGHQLRCSGSWVMDLRHGKQFSVTKFSYELPTDPQAIERLLSSGFLKGVGESSASKIVDYFGKDTFKILEETPDRLYEVESLGRKRIKKILKSWNEKTKLQELFILLCSWGVTQSMTMKILRRWGHEAIVVIKSNPYQLAQEIDGIGFQIADMIAGKLGIDPHSPLRIDAALHFFLWELSQSGHTCYPLIQFVTIASEKLKAETSLIEASISSQFAKDMLVLFRGLKKDNSNNLTGCGHQSVDDRSSHREHYEPRHDHQHLDGLAHPNHSTYSFSSPEPESQAATFIASKLLFHTEQKISTHLKRIQNSPCGIRSVHIEKAVDWAEETLKIRFAERQKKAICCALSNKICIVTGGPGTGKSTITRAIVFIYSKITKKIILTAPTGKAAKRLHEITGTYSQTIHRLLKANPLTGEFFYNSEHPIPCDLLIVDETSMVDTFLAKALFDAIAPHTKVVIIGDADQLPSVGPGSVLRDIIASETIPTETLTDIYRQAKYSNIIENAHLINKGFMPRLSNPEGSDFLFISAKEPEDIRKEVLNFVTRKLPSEYGFDPKKDIQVLVPMRKGTCGIDQLNSDLQTFFSTSARRKWSFAVGDKVIQRKNNYSKEIFNGDVGFIESIDEDEGSISVLFDEKQVVYEENDIDELSLAWAISIHKFQGSECPCVVIPLHTQHFKLLNRNLLYTAVTRGKKLVVLIGSAKAIAIAVHQESKDARWTNLKSALKDTN